MTASAYAQRWKDVMENLRAALNTEIAGGSTWLAKAKEVRVGMHAQAQSFQSAGVYLVPVHDRLEAADSQTYHHTFRIAAVCVVKSLERDGSGTTDAGLDALFELVGGVVDVAKAQRAGGLSNKVLYLPVDGSEIPFTREPVDGSAEFLYIAEVLIDALTEV